MKASHYKKEGYNCAEAIIKAYNDEFDDDIPVSIGSGMGGGAAVASLCGAVNGALVVIGYLKGRSTTEDKNQAGGLSKELLNSVRSEYTSEICKDLKKNRISCDTIIDFAYEELKRILKENK